MNVGNAWIIQSPDRFSLTVSHFSTCRPYSCHISSRVISSTYVRLSQGKHEEPFISNEKSMINDIEVKKWKSGDVLSSSLASSPMSTRSDRRSTNVDENKVKTQGNSKYRDYIPKKDDRRGKKPNDPWWMRGEEESNPLMLKRYRPWWLNNFLVDSSWTVPRLKTEAVRRGLVGVGNKEELISLINKSAATFDLSDDNFTGPAFTEVQIKSLPKCYPEIYSRNN